MVSVVGLTNIHLAFYQMNPWPATLSCIRNLWNPLLFALSFNPGRKHFLST